MIRHARHQQNDRRGFVLLLVGLVMPCIIGMLALIVDGGLAMNNQRRLQNMADSMATSVANRFIRGATSAQCVSAANQIQSTSYPGSNTIGWNAGSDNSINNPPLSGPYAGNAKFIEVVVSAPYPGILSSIFSRSASTIKARAVAGMESHVTGEGVITLDPCLRPGLEVSGGSQLIVAGAVIDNSGGAGYDQNNYWADLGIQQYGASVANNGTMKCEMALVRGGVDTVANFQNFTAGGPNPLYANIRSIFPDPYRTLPVPTQANTPSITNWNTTRKVSFGTGQTATLTPGLYEDISITGSAHVTFSPGTYIMIPKTPNQGLRINGSPTVVGNNVFFYFTGSNYLNTSPGYWDNLDGAVDGPLPPAYGAGCSLPPSPDNLKTVDFATLDINLNSGSVNFTGCTDPNSPYYNFLFFQRRRNTSNAQIQANAGANVFMKGSIYAKWAWFKVAGAGVYQSQFTVGTMTVTGGGQVLIEEYDRNFSMAGFIYLVE